MNSQSMPGSGAGGKGAAISATEFKALVEMVGPDMPEVVIDLLDTYIEESQGLVDALHAGVASGDYASVLRPAHSLKSSSASIGAVHLSRLCADLEAHLRGSLSSLDVPNQVTLIDGEFARVLTALADEKAKLAS